MYRNDIIGLQKRVRQIEERHSQPKNSECLEIYIDFGEQDPADIYLLAVVPPRRKWRGFRR